MISSTLAILRRLHDNLPPHLPEEHIHELRAHVDEYEQRDRSPDTLHTLVHMHGQRLWPHMQAFSDMYRSYEAELAHKLLDQQLSYPMKKKITAFCDDGGSFDDIYHGRVHDIFESDERQKLMELLVDLKQDVRRHAQQRILTQDKQKYHEKVDHYGKLLEEVNTVLEDIRKFANEEQNTSLKHDIEDKVKTVEQSFAYIGPPVDIQEIRNLPEHYRAKREDLRKRGITL